MSKLDPHTPGSGRAAVIVGLMKKGQTVNFVYEGKVKVVEPHAVGTSTKDGSLIMRGFQVAGTSSRPLPVWALYTVAKMELVEPGAEASQAPREGYSMGDAAMADIISQIQL